VEDLGPVLHQQTLAMVLGHTSMRSGVDQRPRSPQRRLPSRSPGTAVRSPLAGRKVVRTFLRGS